MFQRGQVVVCVDAYCPELTLGAYYRVYHVDRCCRDWLDVGIMGAHFLDIPCPYCGTPAEVDGVYFEGVAFRPVHEADATADLAREQEESLKRREHIPAAIPEPA